MQEKRVHQVFVVKRPFQGRPRAHRDRRRDRPLPRQHGGHRRHHPRYSYDELVEDKNDWVANHLLQFAQTFSVAEHNFYAFYLLSHGLIKSVLVIGLLRERLWAYPASFAVFGAFIAYQLYRYSFTHDIGLILLSIFDVFVIGLAVHEYRLLRRHLPTH